MSIQHFLQEYIMNDDNEEKEQKPKKLFTVVHTVWDDGEIDTEMYEFRKNTSGRGAPGKWRQGNKDFKRRVEEVLGDFDQIADQMNSQIGHDNSVDTASCSVSKPIKAPKGHVVDQEELEALDQPSVPVDKTPKVEDIDIDFGEHDVKEG